MKKTSKWIMLLLGGGLIAAGMVVGGKKVVEILIQRRRGALTTDLYKKIKFYANKHGVPLAVALANIDVESGFDIKAYNPNCSGGTRKHGYRVSQMPYVLCRNNKYGYHSRMVDRASKKAWFKAKWERAIDRNKPQLWGAYGLVQIMPDVAWRYGWSPEKPNVGLFDVDVNLDTGLKKLARGWKQRGNLADLRSGYVSGDPYTQWRARSPAEATNAVNKFIERVKMYEDKFDLPRSRKFA